MHLSCTLKRTCTIYASSSPSLCTNCKLESPDLDAVTVIAATRVFVFPLLLLHVSVAFPECRKGSRILDSPIRYRSRRKNMCRQQLSRLIWITYYVRPNLALGFPRAQSFTTYSEIVHHKRRCPSSSPLARRSDPLPLLQYSAAAAAAAADTCSNCVARCAAVARHLHSATLLHTSSSSSPCTMQQPADHGRKGRKEEGGREGGLTVMRARGHRQRLVRARRRECSGVSADLKKRIERKRRRRRAVSRIE